MGVGDAQLELEIPSMLHDNHPDSLPNPLAPPTPKQRPRLSACLTDSPHTLESAVALSGEELSALVSVAVATHQPARPLRDQSEEEPLRPQEPHLKISDLVNWVGRSNPAEGQ